MEHLNNDDLICKANIVKPFVCMRSLPNMKMAGQMVMLDLEHPIDVSHMMINEISEIPTQKDLYSGIILERTTILHAFVNNEGREEELEITFKLKSQRRAKIDEA